MFKVEDSRIMMQNRKMLLILFLFLCHHVGFAQNLKGQIDNIVAAHFKDTTHVGLSIGIIKDGVASDYYFGGKYSNRIKDVDSTTLFEIGSITKIYTSFILASLENEKKISRFDLLSKYLPKNITKGKSWASQIRLVDLVTHTSGLPRFENTKSLMSLEGFNENDPYGIFTESFMLSILKKTDTLSNYGEVAYSNFGIGLLAYAMAKAEKTTFDNLFDKYIVNRQKLFSTFITVNERNLTSIAIPHRKLETMPLIQNADLRAAGSIKSTMPDLLKFLHLHLQPTADVKNVVEMVFTNQLRGSDQKVGLGWGIHTIKNETVYFHNGGTYGSSSIVIIIPSKNSAVALLANNSTDSELTNYALKIVDVLIE